MLERKLQAHRLEIFGAARWGCKMGLQDGAKEMEGCAASEVGLEMRGLNVE